MHYFRNNKVFLQTGNYVMVTSPLGSAVKDFQWSILKGWTKVYNHALQTYFAYLQPLTSYLTFLILLGFPYSQQNVWGLRGKMTPKVKISNTIAYRALPYVKPYFFWAIVCGNRFTILILETRVLRLKTRILRLETRSKATLKSHESHTQAMFSLT